MKSAGNLQVSTPSAREIRMTRIFNAPRHLVFEAMTKPELLKRWLTGPPGWSLEVCNIDLRVGGSYRYVWHGPGGIEMGMGGTYQEIVPPERIVQTEKFDQSWYAGVAVGTLMLNEQNSKTTLTVTMLYESQEVRDAVLKTPMAEGVSMSYDKLAELLASPSA